MDTIGTRLKKTGCALLALLLLITPLASALEGEGGLMTASRAIIDFIEECEGYSQYQYGDSAGYSIGYGTNCDYNEYPMGVSREEAELLLLEHLEVIEKKLNAVMELRAFTLTQNQFDAAVSLSYNIGTAWMDTEIRLYSYIISGVHNYTDSEFASAMGIWCHIGTDIDKGLLKRRIREIKIFLYDDYTGEASPDFYYTIFDAGEGSRDYDIALHREGESYGELPGAEREGYSFDGWYTESGEAIQFFEVADKNQTVYARWSENGAEPPAVEPSPEPSTEPSQGNTTTNPEDNAAYDALKAYYDSLIDVADWQNPFSDVYSNAWYYKYVGALNKAKIINGYPDGSFKPDGTVTCAEALLLILNAAGYGTQTPTGEHWASGYLTLAQSRGFIGYSDITDLDSKISRSLIVKLAARALGIEASNGASPFKDTTDGYAVALYEKKIISGSYAGSDLVFLPASFTTRGQISVIVWNMMLSKLEEVKNEEEPGYETPPDSYTGDAIDFMGHTVYIDPMLELASYTASDFLQLSDNRILTTVPGAKAGIDVSAWQKDIDWRAVAADGIDFAMIRVGYRGYTEGGIFLDPYFNRNIEGALAAGLEVGVYFFSQAISVEEAIQEAEFTLDCIADYRISYPVVFDWEPTNEEDSRTAVYEGSVITSCAEAFCERVKSYGYKPAVYFNCTLGYLKYNLSALTQYDFWLAEYKSAPTFAYAVDMWQYSKAVTVAGISGEVDMNICYKKY